MSPVASYRRMYGFKSMVELNTATADYHAARPIILTSMNSRHVFDPQWVYDPTAFPVDKVPKDYMNIDVDKERHFTTRLEDDLRIGNRWSQMGDDRSLVRQRAEAVLEHSRLMNEASAASEYHEKLANDLNSGRLKAKDVRIDPYTGLPVFGAMPGQLKEEIRENVLQMPIDARVLAQVTPSSRTDLVPILEHATRQACICMGVPPSGLGVGGTHTALEAAASEGVLKSTLQRFRRSVTRCLLDVYAGLYGKRENLTVFFPSLLNTATAKALFEESILTYEAFCDHICTLYSIPQHNIVARGELNPEHKKAKLEMDFEHLRREVAQE